MAAIVLNMNNFHTKLYLGVLYIIEVYFTLAFDSKNSSKNCKRSEKIDLKNISLGSKTRRYLVILMETFRCHLYTSGNQDPNIKHLHLIIKWLLYKPYIKIVMFYLDLGIKG